MPFYTIDNVEVKRLLKLQLSEKSVIQEFNNVKFHHSYLNCYVSQTFSIDIPIIDTLQFKVFNQYHLCTLQKTNYL